MPPAESSRGDEAVQFARDHGLELDEWQADVLRGALGVRANGKWAASEVGVVVPRQNGKGAILEARELAGMFLFGESLITHSAHMIDTSLEHFRRLLGIIEDNPDLDREVLKVSNTNGREGIELRGGLRIRFRTRSKSAGRGFTGNTLILDEAMFLPEFAFGALMPSLSAKYVTENPQVWYTGSAVDQEVHEHGVVLARVRERGIARTDRFCFFEWSPDTELTAGEVRDADLERQDWWQDANPAYPHRIAAEAIETEYGIMARRTFAVERLGVGDWPRTDATEDTVISYRDFAALLDGQSEALDPVCIAFDVSPDRRASIAAAGRRADGLFHVEVIENGRGTSWIAPRLAELVARHEVALVICDGFGPAASMLPSCDEHQVAVTTTTSGEMAQACGRLADAVNEKLFRHRGSEDLLDAVRGAKSRPLSDRWAWARSSSSTDISPLVAATLALSAAMDQSTSADFTIY